MITLNLTLDDKMLAELDDVMNEINSNRHDFINALLTEWLRLYQVRQAEKKHRESYQNDPETAEELDWLMAEQVWPEWERPEGTKH